MTQTAERTLKAAAKIKRPSLYAELKDLNLNAKEFKYHEKCYKEFTRNVTVEEPQLETSTSSTPNTIQYNTIKVYPQLLQITA